MRCIGISLSAKGGKVRLRECRNKAGYAPSRPYMGRSLERLDCACTRSIEAIAVFENGGLPSEGDEDLRDYMKTPKEWPKRPHSSWLTRQAAQRTEAAPKAQRAESFTVAMSSPSLAEMIEKTKGRLK